MLAAIALGGWALLSAAVVISTAAEAPATNSGPYVAAGEPAPSRLALSEIPPEYLRLYRLAAARYGIDWAVLAGIGRIECDHGRDPAASCHVEGAVNGAGAGGPMQFLSGTWDRYGVDGDGDGRIDRWDPADAIFGAANYLRASGAPSDYRRAIFAYNHAAWYVREVEAWAARYSTPGGAEADPPRGPGPEALQALTRTPVKFIEGERSELDEGDGHVALIPEDVPFAVQAMLIAGNELQDLPYGPSGHPDPRGATQEDCSSTVNYVLFRAGIRPISEILRQNPLAQDYVHWGEPGPGRWVTIYATDVPTPHVFIVIAGLRLDTAFAGIDEGPNRTQSGPRWRVLDRIPSWAPWSVRHPPGL